MAEGQWRICLLGRLEAQDNGQVVIRFAGRRLSALLACLVLRAPHPISRQELLALLWPDEDPDTARNRLRVLLSSLRGRLEPAGVMPGSVLDASRTAIHLLPDSFTSDYQDFLQAIQEAKSSSDDSEALFALERAQALYQGELLVGHYDDWAVAERSRLAEMRYRALRESVRCSIRIGAPERGVEPARLAVAMEPLDEEAHCELIRLYGEIGQPSAGLRQYQQLQRLLAEELKAEPSRAARELAADMEAKLGHGVAGKRRYVRAIALRATERVHELAPVESHLPVRLTRFIGREDELQLLQSLLAPAGPARLVSLLGPGGAGKTRLAVEAAERMATAYHGRVFFAPLADVSDPNQVGLVLAAALRLTPTPGIDPLSQAMAALNAAPALLVMDNMEQLLPDAAPLVECLLSEAQALRCLLTSRRTAGIDGEQEIALGPLPLPGNGIELDKLSRYPGVALFVDRARAVHNHFTLTLNNAEDVTRLCHMLEGLPLAIELAAARIRVMTPGEMCEQTDKLSHWLVDVRGGKVARHRSLRAAMEWSFLLLTPAERRHFSALAVFADGFTAEAAGAVALVEQVSTLDAIALIEPLRAASMLTVVETASARTRFGMLDMLREFGLERLAESGEQNAVRERHLAYYCELVRNSAGRSRQWNSAELSRIAVEDANLRAALEFGLGAEANDEARRIGLELAGMLSGYWELQGRWKEGLVALRKAIAMPTTNDNQALRVRALQGAGALANLLGDPSEARSLSEQGLEIARNLDELEGIAGCLTNLGNVAFALGDYAESRDRIEAALRIYRETADFAGIAGCVSILGNVAFFVGDHTGARERLQEAAALYGQVGDRQGVASVLLKLGNVLRNQNRFDEARARLDESLATYTEIGNKSGIAGALNGLGLAAVYQSDHFEALARFTEAMEIYAQLGSRRGGAGCLLALGRVAIDQGDLGQAEDFCTRALDLFRELEDRRNIGASLLHLGELAFDKGDLADAQAYMTEALEIEHRIQSAGGMANCLFQLGRLEIVRGGQVRGREQLAEALEIYHDMDIPLGVARVLESFADLALRNRRWVRAAHLKGAAAAILQTIGSTRSVTAAKAHAEAIGAIRAALGEPVFEAVWSEGSALSAEDAVALALEGGN